MADTAAAGSSNSGDAPQERAATVVKVDHDRLHRVGARLGFFAYLRETWRTRSFIFYDAKSRFKSENDEDKLGLLWTVINPILLGISFYFVFGLLLQTSRGIENFVGFLIIGIFTFQYSTRAVTRGARAISSNRKVIAAFQFPRLALPLSIAVREAIGYIPILGTMIFLILVFPPMEEFTWRWVLIIPAFICQFMFNLGLSLILARIIAFHVDVANMLSFAMRIWMYTSGVFYSLDRYANYPVLRELLELNPLHQVMTVLRQSMLYATTPSWTTWGILAFWALSTVIVGVIVFWQAEERYGKDITAV
ncbi:ABC transporter permease [Micrococcoides hystricis]|uniref:Transport permease protein n=1 Tax=Micrococcoides hystricis TaxID=1572761 RepID=A0ABV6PC33_9MICC